MPTGPPAAQPRPRYRFGEFVVSPGRRLLLRGGAEVPIIPRYFDVLMLLIERRHESVHRREIVDRVWADVVVSDGALSQAVRTLRRALGDDPREPRYIRTVARHGYRFVHVGVAEEDDGPEPGEVRPITQPGGTPGEAGAPPGPPGPGPDPFEPLLLVLLRAGAFHDATHEERRDAAAQLHALGTAEALRRLDARPGHQEARAILRDTRWDVAGAGQVPLLASEGGLRSATAVVALRLRDAAGPVAGRWAGATLGGAVAGALAGLAGGLILLLLPGSGASASVLGALALVGAAAGGTGACGIGGALAAVEALARSGRGVALPLAGAAAGAATGAVAHLAGWSLVQALFGHGFAGAGGWAEGLAIGASAGAGYALSTSGLRGGGLATPRRGARARAALLAGSCCAAGGLAVALAGGHLVGASLDVLAAGFDGSQVGLGPIARWLGEQDLRPVTRAAVSAFEGLMFGMGLVTGLTRRPRPLNRP